MPPSPARLGTKTSGRQPIWCRLRGRKGTRKSCASRGAGTTTTLSPRVETLLGQGIPQPGCSCGRGLGDGETAPHRSPAWARWRTPRGVREDGSLRVKAGPKRGRQPAARPGQQRGGGGSATGGNPVARLVASSDRQSHSTGWTRGQRDPRERLDTSPAGGRPRPERKRGRAAGGPPQGRRPTAVAGCESTRQADSSSL